MSITAVNAILISYDLAFTYHQKLGLLHHLFCRL